ncbi:LacI family DNA-binding transcriptional regulator [Algoriphagus aestuarii]|nr:LacI family DNA-binding transcriptional regulator [Algoriphagus aestuarii]
MRDSSYNIQKIAKSLGLSVTTVSRVISNQTEKYRISAKTAKIVRDFIEVHQIEPNEIARQLRMKSTKTIGLIVPDIANPFFSEIARSIENEARNNGYFVILGDSNDDQKLEEELVSLMQKRRVDGLIIAPVGKDSKTFKQLVSRNFPIVFVDRYFEELDGSYVSSSNYEGAVKATKFLIGNGHRNIACLQGLQGTSTNSNRVKGYLETLESGGLISDRNLVKGDSYSESDGYHNALILLKEFPQITAVLCLSNLIALGALRAIKELGKKVPEDISLITFDDQPYFQFFQSPLTTVAQQMSSIGTSAFQILLDHIVSENPFLKQKLLLDMPLIERESVRIIG